VAVLIQSNKYKHPFDEVDGDFELSYGVDGIIKDKLAKCLPTFSRTLAISIAMFIFSFLPLLYSGILSNSKTLPLYMLVVLILLIGIGVYQLILVSARKNAYEKILKQGDFAPDKIKVIKKAEQVGAFYWPLVVAIYLGWSLWTHDWHITWIVWPVGALFFAALLGLAQLVAPKEK
jgi:uncharacterized membrane protein YesL